VVVQLINDGLQSPPILIDGLYGLPVPEAPVCLSPTKSQERRSVHYRILEAHKAQNNIDIHPTHKTMYITS
jgi:hypothetical protein